MDWEKAKRLTEHNAPTLAVMPIDMNMPALLAVRPKTGTQVFSIQIPEGDDELAEAQLLMMVQHARSFLLQNQQPAPPRVR